MHELSIMGEVLRIVENTVVMNNLNKVSCVVLQVGELTSVVPDYLVEYYPAVTYKTSLEGTELRLEIIEGIGKCCNCGKKFNVLKKDGTCPDCKSKNFDVVSGRDFVIKEILAD